MCSLAYFTSESGLLYPSLCPGVSSPFCGKLWITVMETHRVPGSSLSMGAGMGQLQRLINLSGTSYQHNCIVSMSRISLVETRLNISALAERRYFPGDRSIIYLLSAITKICYCFPYRIRSNSSIPQILWHFSCPDSECI